MNSIDKQVLKVDDELYPKISHVQSKILKIIQNFYLNFAEWEKEWSRLLNKQNRKQKFDLKENSYTFLNKYQAKRMFKDNESEFNFANEYFVRIFSKY